MTINSVVANIDSLINRLVYSIRGIEQNLDFSFISHHLSDLRNSVNSNLLPSLKQMLENVNDYYLLEEMIIRTLNKVINFFSDKLSLLVENKKKLLNKLKDQYLYLSLIKDYIPNYILNYYRMFNQIISIKTVSYTKKEEYDVTFDKKKFLEDYLRNKEMLKRTSQSQNNYLINMKEKTEEDEEDGFDDVLEEDFGYGDVAEQDDEFAKGVILFPGDLDDPSKDNNDEKESKLDKWGKKLVEEKISLETEITYEFKNWSNFEVNIKNNAAKEWGWFDFITVQFPIVFPALPQLQFRCGIKFELYVKLKIGVEISINLKTEDGKFDPSTDIGLLIDFSLGIKLTIFAEVGFYGAVISVKGGIEGTIADVRAGFKLSFNLVKFYSDFYIYLKFYAFLFRVYAEAEIDIKFWKVTARFVDIPFGINEPLLECSFLIRYNWFKEFSEPVKKCE